MNRRVLKLVGVCYAVVAMLVGAGALTIVFSPQAEALQPEASPNPLVISGAASAVYSTDVAQSGVYSVRLSNVGGGAASVRLHADGQMDNLPPFTLSQLQGLDFSTYIPAGSQAEPMIDIAISNPGNPSEVVHIIQSTDWRVAYDGLPQPAEQWITRGDHMDVRYAWLCDASACYYEASWPFAVSIRNFVEGTSPAGETHWSELYAVQPAGKPTWLDNYPGVNNLTLWNVEYVGLMVGEDENYYPWGGPDNNGEVATMYIDDFTVVINGVTYLYDFEPEQGPVELYINWLAPENWSVFLPQALIDLRVEAGYGDGEPVTVEWRYTDDPTTTCETPSAMELIGSDNAPSNGDEYMITWDTEGVPVGSYRVCAFAYVDGENEGFAEISLGIFPGLLEFNQYEINEGESVSISPTNVGVGDGETLVWLVDVDGEGTGVNQYSSLEDVLAVGPSVNVTFPDDGPNSNHDHDGYYDHDFEAMLFIDRDGRLARLVNDVNEIEAMIEDGELTDAEMERIIEIMEYYVEDMTPTPEELNDPNFPEMYVQRVMDAYEAEVDEIFEEVGDPVYYGGGYVRVHNIAPAVSMGSTDPDNQIVAGESITFTGDFSDPGVRDTHSTSWQILNSDGAVVASGSGATLSYGFNDPGEYTVRFIVVDDDGGQGVTEMRVNVGAVQGVLASLAETGVSSSAQLALSIFGLLLSLGVVKVTSLMKLIVR